MLESSASDKTISIALVDAQLVLTDALAVAIGQEPDLCVVGSAASCAASRELFARVCADVILLDVSLADGDGLSLIPELRERCPQTRILVLTSFVDETTLLRAIDSGVNGFVSKIRPMSELLAGIRQAAAGQIVMPTNLLLGLLARPPQPAKGQHRNQLTPRRLASATCSINSAYIPTWKP